MTLTIRLPWPPKELSPNARVHWARKHQETQGYRGHCYYIARAAAPPIAALKNQPITAHVVFVVPDKRRRDLDNAMASMKAAWDGLVDAGLLVDDDSEHLKLAAPEMRYEKGERYVEVTLT